MLLNWSLFEMENRRHTNSKLILLSISLKNSKIWNQSSKAAGIKMKNEASIQWDSSLMELDTSSKEPFNISRKLTGSGPFKLSFCDLKSNEKSRISSIWEINSIQHSIWKTRSPKWICYSVDSWSWTWWKTSTWILCWISRWSSPVAWFRTCCHVGKGEILAWAILRQWVIRVYSFLWLI